MLEATFGWLLVAARALERHRRCDEPRAGAGERRRGDGVDAGIRGSRDDRRAVPAARGSRRQGLTRPFALSVRAGPALSECSLIRLPGVTTARPWTPPRPSSASARSRWLRTIRRAMIAEQAIPLFIEQGSSLTHEAAGGASRHRRGHDLPGVRRQGRARPRGGARVLRPRRGASVHRASSMHRSRSKRRSPRLVRGAREHARGVFAMLSLLDPAEAGEYIARARSGAFEAAIAEAFAPDAASLGVPPDRVAALLRIAVIAASAPPHHRHSPAGRRRTRPIHPLRHRGSSPRKGLTVLGKLLVRYLSPGVAAHRRPSSSSSSRSRSRR